MLDMARRAWGTGSLYQRASDQRWIGQYEVDDGSGLRRRRFVTGKSKTDVTRRLRELSRSSRSTHGTSESLAAYLERWLDDAVRPNVRNRTLAGYRTIVDRHLVPGLGGIALGRLTAPDVQRFVNAQLAVYSPRSVGHQLAALRTALGQAVRWGLVERNVASLVPAPRVPVREVRPLTAAEARQLLQAVAGDPREALYVLAVTTGMRQGELLALRWQDVDLERRQLLVSRTLHQVGGQFRLEETKTARSRRTIPLTELAIRALREHRKRQLQEPDRTNAGFVFTRRYGSPLSASQVTREFQAHLERAGLPRQTFHGLRHAAASYLLAQGVPMRVIADILGHSTPTVTANIYSHLEEGATREAVERLDEALG